MANKQTGPDFSPLEIALSKQPFLLRHPVNSNIVIITQNDANSAHFE